MRLAHRPAACLAPALAIAATVSVLALSGASAVRASDAPPVAQMPAQQAADTAAYPPAPAAILGKIAESEKRRAAAPLAGLIAERAPLVAAAIPRLPAAERAALVAYYADRDNAPLWIEGDNLTPRAHALAARLGAAGEDGLFARDYALPSLETADKEAGKEARIEAELRLSALALLYARDARGGRIEPRRLSNLITPKLVLPGAREVLDRLATAPDAGAALQAYNPAHEGYRALKARLADLRKDRTAEEPMVRIPDGPPLRLGMRDARVPLIRARLKLNPSDDMTYDGDLASAVSAFQRSTGLQVTGVAGSATLDALRRSPEAKLDADIVAQMERWRWLPADLGERHIFVNIPEFTVRVVENGAVIHQARTIVGKPQTPTPIFSDVMDHVVVNPSWFIPPSILKKDILPKLATDPDYAARRGYVVTRRGNSISVRQPPGERNALGHVKFMFPNEHAVYLHDTPGRHLFNTATRAYSHGCVRVDQPMKFGELVLGREEGWTEQRLRGMVGSGERTVRLARPLQVHLAYQTHVIGADGALTTHPDLYGFHARVKAALGLGG